MTSTPNPSSAELESGHPNRSTNRTVSRITDDQLQAAVRVGQSQARRGRNTALQSHGQRNRAPAHAR